jgi:UDP-N-acetylglucosamine 2-epimerase (non-hydrolysing)
MKSILAVVGARPNFMKIAPVIEAFRRAQIPVKLVHTGQHYDEAMKASFFGQLGIPEPDVDLEVGSGSHAEQTGQIMIRFEPVLERFAPAAVLVVGDVNSTIACALVAVKKAVPVFHVEAGLRSGDRSMPEEINRVLTDQLSELLFTTEAEARDNLRREGIADEQVHFVGNVMIDSLLGHTDRAVAPAMTLARFGREDLIRGGASFGVVTLHRPSNVDDPAVLTGLMETLVRVSERVPLVFPVHPRTESRLRELDIALGASLALLPPVGYLEMLGLMKEAALVLTDSGGMQEETTALGVPCVTLRENTERPITVSEGTNTIVGSDEARILAAVDSILTTGGKKGRRPELWDGRAADRIASVVGQWLQARPSAAGVVEKSRV